MTTPGTVLHWLPMQLRAALELFRVVRRRAFLRVRLRRRETGRLGIGMLVALGVAVLVTLASLSNAFELLRLQSTDFFFRTRPEEAAVRSVLVGVDERTVSELRDQGRLFVWDRALHAKVIDNLAAAKARVIVLDILFDSPAPGDAELARAIERAGNVVQPVAGDEGTRGLRGLADPLSFERMLSPLPEFLEFSAGTGHANQSPDGDGTVRRVPLVIEVQGRQVPALALVAAQKFLRRKEWADAPPGNGTLLFTGRQIPVDGANRMFVNWLGAPSETGRPSSITQISYVDVLRGEFDRSLVDGKMVFIGATATGFADDYWVPTSETTKMDGVEIHAQTAETIVGRPGEISARLYSQASPWLTATAVVSAVLLMAVAVYSLSPFYVFLLGVILVFVYLVGAQVAFASGMLLDLVTPPLALALSFGALTANRVLFEQRERRVLRGMFASYVPHDVVEELARDPDQLRRLGSGQRREISVLFADLRGFTSISEEMDPERLARIINQFFSAMTRTIFDQRGTVDKYIGDAVMAFWNAPRDEAEHALLSCRTALRMQQALSTLATHLTQTEGTPLLSMRIGINTGAAAVGNMGSELRLAYTALGDTVNLAARLEPLNSEYGTSICISEFTLKAAGEERLLTRFLDLVAVKGRREPVAVFELLAEGALDSALDEPTRRMLEQYAQGITHYGANDFGTAATFFKEALALAPDDGPSALYLERCRDLLEDPPVPGWDGVFVMKHK